jgi:RNA polymerase sigma-70 factor (ECF subfamily)
LPEQYAKDALHSLETADRNASLQKAIQQLSADDAGVITLFYLYENSLEEICEIMSLSMTNAKTKLSRARQRLRAIVEAEYQELM